MAVPAFWNDHAGFLLRGFEEFPASRAGPGVVRPLDRGPGTPGCFPTFPGLEVPRFAVLALVTRLESATTEATVFGEQLRMHPGVTIVA